MINGVTCEGFWVAFSLEVCVIFARSPLSLQAVHSRGQHSISFTLSRNQTVVVEYCHDNSTDMFQVTAEEVKNSRVDVSRDE